MNFKGWTAVIDTNLNGTFHMCKEGKVGSLLPFVGAYANNALTLFILYCIVPVQVKLITYDQDR